MKEFNAKWMWFDPLNDYFDPHLNPKDALHVSAVLNPLKPVCEELDVTVIGNLHLNRSEGMTGAKKIAHSQTVQALMPLDVHPAPGTR